MVLRRSTTSLLLHNNKFVLVVVVVVGKFSKAHTVEWNLNTIKHTFRLLMFLSSFTHTRVGSFVRILSINKTLLSEKFHFECYLRNFLSFSVQNVFAVLFRFTVIQFEWLVECFFIAVMETRRMLKKFSRFLTLVLVFLSFFFAAAITLFSCLSSFTLSLFSHKILGNKWIYLWIFPQFYFTFIFTFPFFVAFSCDDQTRWNFFLNCDRAH